MATTEPFLMTGRVGPQTGADGDERVARFGHQLEQIVGQLHGNYYETTRRGRVFSQAATPLGLAIPIYTATALAGGMPIWNPAGSGVNVVPIEIGVAYGSGTADFGAIGLMAISTGLSAIATGAFITAFAETTPKNGFFSKGSASQVKSSNAGTVTTTAGAAGDWQRTLFTINLEAQTGTAHATTAAKYEFDGSFILPPGCHMYVAATKASAALYATYVVWEEVPIFE